MTSALVALVSDTCEGTIDDGIDLEPLESLEGCVVGNGLDANGIIGRNGVDRVDGIIAVIVNGDDCINGCNGSMVSWDPGALD